MTKGGVFIKHRPIILLVLSFLIIILAGCQHSSESADEEEQTNNDSDTPTNQEADIDGTLWDAEGKTGVILSHGAAYDADSWEAQGKELASNGIVTFAVEDTAPDQLIAAAKMLKEDYNVSNVALVGASAGGSTAIDAANDDTFDFDRVILLSPSGEATDIEEIPVLVIYSEEEGFETLEENIEEQNNSSIETSPIPGNAHAQAMFDDEKTGNKVIKQMIEFLDS